MQDWTLRATIGHWPPQDVRELAVIIIDDQVVWSASDLTTAAGCEYAFLRRLDEKLHRTVKAPALDDPLQKQIANLGLAHEARVLGELVEQLGDHDAGLPGRGHPARDGGIERPRWA